MLFILFVGIDVQQSFASSQDIDVEPMLKSAWGQDVPYSDSVVNTAKAGCGAVAMAQILRYYKPYKHAFGHTSYDVAMVYPKKKTVTITRNFETSPIDWDNILDKYVTGNYSSIQASAVAGFIYLVGNAIHIQYGIDSVGESAPANDGQTIWGIHHFLHISPTAIRRYRKYYSTKEWTEMIDNNLKEGHPLIYGGVWYYCDSKSIFHNVSHLFVLDGKNSSGLYHFNFGMGKDAYIHYSDLNVMNVLSESNLSETPAPGNRIVCYPSGQNMITDCYPVEDGIYQDCNLMITTPLVLLNNPSLREYHPHGGENMTIATVFRGYNDKTVMYSVKAMLSSSDGQTQNCGNVKYYGLGPGVAEGLTCNLNIPKALSDGTYKIKFYCCNKDDANSEWRACMEAVPVTMTLVVSNGQYTLSLPQNHTLASHLYLRSSIKEVNNVSSETSPGHTYQVSISNPSDNNFTDTLRLDFKFEDGHTDVLYTVGNVYDHQNVDFKIFAPTSKIKFDGGIKYEISTYYYERNEKKYIRLDEQESGIVDVGINEHGKIAIYSLDGFLLRTCGGTDDVNSALHKLAVGIYVLKQGNHSRKIFVK